MEPTSTGRQRRAQNRLSRSQGNDLPSQESHGELELDDSDGADWTTVGNQIQAKCEESDKEVSKEIDSLAEEFEENCLLEEDCERGLETSELEDSSCPVPPAVARQIDVDKVLKENSALKERREALLMCQICFEFYDDGKHAKFSHGCGHGCCLTCMKMEFARQRE
ncbi:Oidioi.mRNA.OKI2018_I69.PAR.g13188.t1.cds [Oikopleura dioica]|uniref:Oidioi.mRNA.OKI2018_I69.PAR.g13188.t1.cds n=1 Tax=Oikopleura dioica TaxID=34765 RepID=A0ABN7S595_OIKDI|nr:Oidioi.mRNA.OKI2018_I69.PAR.g13188.t1.cds [Oikopleura dioica]